MKYIDLHCDTLMIHAKPDTEGDLYSSKDSAVDVKRLNDAGAMAQFFAIFMLPYGTFEEEGIPEVNDDMYILHLSGMLKKTAEEHSDLIRLAHNYDELIINDSKKVTSAFLTLEDGRAVEGSFDRLRKFYNEGIRLIGLTWNFENCFGYPNSRDAEIMKKGLKPFGKQAIELMNEMGIIIDVSHLSDGGFYDIADICRKPFIASHSNARALTDHPRNLTDDMIRIIADKGGVIGLNFCPAFLAENSEDSRIDDMIRHLKYIKNVGSADVLAIGSDLDGIGGNLEISEPARFNLLFDRLTEENFTAEEIEKLAWKNAARVIKDVL